VHDRHSMARQPEPALAGAASGEFATAQAPQNPLADRTGPGDHVITAADPSPTTSTKPSTASTAVQVHTK
jgi:hypothetical protein